VDTTIRGIRVKSGLQLLYEESKKNTIYGWASIAGVSASDIIALAQEFTSHGKRAVVEIHRGVSQHTNGFYNVLAHRQPRLEGRPDLRRRHLRGDRRDRAPVPARRPPGKDHALRH